MTRSASPAAPIAYEEEPFYFVQRRSRSLGSYVSLVFFAAMIVAPPAIGIIKRVSPFGSQGLFYFVELPLMLFGALCFFLTLIPVVKNRVEETVVDRSGIRYKWLSWAWDELAWIGPSRGNEGGVWIAFKSKGNRGAPFRLTLGRALSIEQFELVMQRIQSWASVHAPHVTIEATVPPRARALVLWRAGVSFAIAAGAVAMMFSSFARYRYPAGIRLIFAGGALMGLHEGIKTLRDR